jgi:two-component system NarL family sensor kinase
MLDDLGLGPAVRFLAEGVSKRTGLFITADALAEERFPAPVELALYRIVQEALTNAAKHARARKVRIEVRREAHLAWCEIQDDGKGFNLSAVSSDKTGRGLGLVGMRERASSLGGRLEIKSRPGRGTQIVARLPLGS